MQTSTYLRIEPMNKDTFLAVARRVIGLEAQALEHLAGAVGDSFADAAELILHAKGRVIVSGIGKSGHIARKIAATLASTGTPAHFVHPAEASHGDLGVVTSDDVALAISYSGEAAELSDLVAYTRRFGIPLIGLSGREDSALIRQCDIALILPPADEACSTGVVPTTSTTMTLGSGRCSGGGFDGTPLIHGRKFSQLSSRRQTWRAPFAGA